MFKDIGANYNEAKQKIFNDLSQWYNVFYQQVFYKIKDSIFKTLYLLDNGRSNASVKLLLAMMVFKEGFGCHDKQLFMEAQFNNLMMAALGLRNADQYIPLELTYYKFRSDLLKYNEVQGIDLLDENFQGITLKQIIEFDVKGSKTKMDWKLINRNIARNSRLALILNVIKKIIRKQMINKLMKAGLTSSQYDFLVR